MRPPTTKLVLVVAGSWLPLASAAEDGPAPIVKVHVTTVDWARGELSVQLPPGISAGSDDRLLAATGIDPFGWLTHLDGDGGAVRFRAGPGVRLPRRPERIRAWLVRADVMAYFLDRWPVRAPLAAELESIGPGHASVWITAGSSAGVRVGDAWWLRIGSQPVARFDVRLVEPELCFCSATRLVADAPLSRGRRVELWPGPGRRRNGTSRSAVVYVERGGAEQRVWIAAPPRADTPSEPGLDIFRDGHYVGHAVVESTDERFWYARVIAARAPARTPTSRSARMPLEEAGQPPARAREEPNRASTSVGATRGAILVGDDVVIRTRADIARKRFVARVFAVTPEGCLITAGEADGLALGERSWAYRAGRPRTEIVIRRIQRGYCIIRPLRPEGDGALRIGDTIRFAPPPKPPLRVARIERVACETLFRARLESGAAPPLLEPLEVQTTPNTSAAAILVAVDGSNALGFVFEPSLLQPLSPGMAILVEPPAESRASHP